MKTIERTLLVALASAASGFSDPIADNKTAEGRARNRRADVEVRGTRTGP